MVLAFLSAVAFTGPEKTFNFVPCNLIKISTHDFIKAAIGLCS